jgi:hypothetical protein
MGTNGDVEAVQDEVPAAPARPSRARRVVAAVLIVLAALGSAPSLVGGYVRGDLLSTDRYVAIVGPLARDQAVQAEVVDAVTAAVLDRVRVDELTRDALEVLRARDDRLARLLAGDRRLAQALEGVVSGLGPLVENQLEAATRRAAERVVHSERFGDLWIEANRRAHAATLRALRDEGSVLRTTDGVVQVDISVIVEEVKRRLVDRGLSLAARIPTTDSQIVLIRSAELAQAQAALRIFDQTSPWLPWLTLAAAVAAVAVAPARRRALQWLGVALVIAMVACALTLVLARRALLDRVASGSIDPVAMAAVADAALAPLWSRLWLVLGLSALIAVLAWLSGPAAARLRGRLRGTPTP